MTYEHALDRAETRVYVYMNAGDIDYYFDKYKLEVKTSKGKKKAKPTRSEKEEAIIEYLTLQNMDKSEESVDRVQAIFEERFKHDIKLITGGV